MQHKTNKMKHKTPKTYLLALFSLLLFFPLSASAVPAYPGKIKARQADGTIITIQRLGDEHCNMTVTADGYPLVFNDKTQNWEYAKLVNNDLVSSGVRAKEANERPVKDWNILKSVDKSKVMASYREKFLATTKIKQGPRPDRIVRISDVPTTGTHDVLVILVQFSNSRFTTMTNPAEYYDRFFHQAGFSDNDATGSVYDFYHDGSNGKYDPQFKVYGPVTMSHGYSYYSGSGGYTNTWKMIKEAVNIVDSLYDVDFTKFDTDGDGEIDNVYCIYAGYGQADTDLSSVIWPHSAYLKDASVYDRSTHGYVQSDERFAVDGVNVDRYTVSQEINGQTKKTCGIGTLCHEFGHVLGFADHYNPQTNDGFLPPTNQLGQWDIMASGSYNNNQNTPPTFNAFERYSLGWMDLTNLNPNTDTTLSLQPFEDSCMAYRISLPDSVNRPGEYFILENRQQKGWDTYLPGHGLLVWHIDEDQAIWDSNLPNIDEDHQRIDIVEADGQVSYDGKASDAFPGTANVTAFTFPSWHDGNIFSLSNITETGEGIINFNIAGCLGNEPTAIKNIFDSNRAVGDSNIYDLYGRRVSSMNNDGHAVNNIPKGIYIYNNRKIMIR